MKNLARILASGLLLSGCAGGGALVSAGQVNYSKLFASLRCEIADVYEEDVAGTGALGTAGGEWLAAADVVFTGTLARGAALDADLIAHDIGSGDTLTAGAGFERKSEDSGKLTLGFSLTKINEIECDKQKAASYDLSSLGLGAWYRKVNTNLENKDGNKLLKQLLYKRIVTFAFIDGEVRLALFSPVRVGPALKLYNGDLAEVTITFQPPPPPGKPAVVALDDETLRRLAALITTGTLPPGSAKATTQQPDDVLDRIEKRETNEILQRLEDRF